MQHGNEVTILVASSVGHLSKVVLLIPQHSGATPSDVQVSGVPGSCGFCMFCELTLDHEAKSAIQKHDPAV